MKLSIFAHKSTYSYLLKSSGGSNKQGGLKIFQNLMNGEVGIVPIKGVMDNPGNTAANFSNIRKNS